MSIKTIFKKGNDRYQLEGKPITEFDFSKDKLHISYRFPMIAVFFMELKAIANNPKYCLDCSLEANHIKYNVIEINDLSSDTLEFVLEKV